MRVPEWAGNVALAAFVLLWARRSWRAFEQGLAERGYDWPSLRRGLALVLFPRTWVRLRAYRALVVAHGWRAVLSRRARVRVRWADPGGDDP